MTRQGLVSPMDPVGSVDPVGSYPPDPAGPTEPPPQLTLSAVSSMTKDVWSEEPSVPVNLSVTVCPA